MTNFDFLKNEPKFKDFADVAISAERIFQFDYAASVLNCRRAMEFAVKCILWTVPLSCHGMTDWSV